MILPPATLGLLGGGQLGRFFVIAAQEMGYRVIVVDPDPDCPAARVADRHLCTAYDDPQALATLAADCAAISTEFENVPADALAELESRRPVHPSAQAVAICQNRQREKEFLRAHGVAQGPWLAVASADDLAAADPALFPAILKRAESGYDGKGQASVADRAQALAAFAAWGGAPCVLEKRLPLAGELSVVLARSAAGEVRAYPAAENLHRDGILDLSLIPARIAPEQAAAALAIAGRIAAALDYIGVLAVEFFISDDRLLVNELAPRPHNSGHFSLDAAICSQFEQQVRALCGLPLGDSQLHSAAAMVNLLGDLWHPGGKPAACEPDWRGIFAHPGVKLHLYGKADPRPQRKMGHLTALAANPAAALALAEAARAALSRAAL